MPKKDANGNTTWSTTELVTAVVVSLAVGATAAVLLDEDNKFDEDRPPIIVSNGSADFEGKSNHQNYGKATWVQTPANQDRVFKHEQPGGAAVTGFTVNTDPAAPAPTCTQNGNPANPTLPIAGNVVTVSYSTDAAPNTLTTSTMTISGGALLLTLAEDGELQGQGKKIKVKDVNGQPENRKKVRSFSAGGFSCTVPNQGSTSVVVTQER